MQKTKFCCVAFIFHHEVTAKRAYRSGLSKKFWSLYCSLLGAGIFIYVTGIVNGRWNVPGACSMTAGPVNMDKNMHSHKWSVFVFSV